MEDFAIRIESLYVGISGMNIIENVSLQIPKGKITVLIGINGSGKSTLLKAISKILPIKKGNIYLNGIATHQMSFRELAKKLAMLPQTYDSQLSMTVRELVEQGRFPHSGALKMLRKQDHIAIEYALELTNLSTFQNRHLDELSGGERQRAWLALSLAQASDILLLDEPTTFLDVRHQLDLLNLIKQLNQNENKTIVMVLHDINQALNYADHIIILKDRGIYAQGNPHKVITEQMLIDVYKVKARIIEDPISGHSVCIPYQTVGHTI